MQAGPKALPESSGKWDSVGRKDALKQNSSQTSLPRMASWLSVTSCLTVVLLLPAQGAILAALPLVPQLHSLISMFCEFGLVIVFLPSKAPSLLGQSQVQLIVSPLPPFFFLVISLGA